MIKGIVQKMSEMDWSLILLSVTFLDTNIHWIGSLKFNMAIWIASTNWTDSTSNLNIYQLVLLLLLLLPHTIQRRRNKKKEKEPKKMKMKPQMSGWVVLVQSGSSYWMQPVLWQQINWTCLFIPLILSVYLSTKFLAFQPVRKFPLPLSKINKCVCVDWQKVYERMNEWDVNSFWNGEILCLVEFSVPGFLFWLVVCLFVCLFRWCKKRRKGRESQEKERRAMCKFFMVLKQLIWRETFYRYSYFCGEKFLSCSVGVEERKRKEEGKRRRVKVEK